MGSLSVGHWLVVLLVVVLVFGTKKLGNMGGDLGKAIKGFKDAVKENEKPMVADATSLNDQSGPAASESKIKESANLG